MKPWVHGAGCSTWTLFAGGAGARGFSRIGVRRIGAEGLGPGGWGGLFRDEVSPWNDVGATIHGPVSAGREKDTCMGIIVQKYGGTSVDGVSRLKAVARKIVETRRAGHSVVAVVSAMGKTTDALLELAREISPDPPRRELDMLLSTGERRSIALLAMAIHALGEEAVSLTGSQSAIITNDSHVNARIIEVRPYRIQDELEKGRIVIVAGYQGVSYRREITTLGRGGTDTTAIALAAALGADQCDIYSDVDGIYSGDPVVVSSAEKIDALSYEEMQELARHGARVLNAQAVEFARRHRIAVYAKAAFSEGEGTRVERRDGLLDESLRRLRAFGVQSVTGREDVIRVRNRSGVALERGTCRAVLDALRAHEMLTARVDPVDGRLDILLITENLADVDGVIASLERRFGAEIEVISSIGVAAAVGLGVGDAPGALEMALEVLDRAGIPVVGAVTAREAITVMVSSNHVRSAIEALHRAFVEERRSDGKG